jgi:hypothetical protein
MDTRSSYAHRQALLNRQRPSQIGSLTIQCQLVTKRFGANSNTIDQHRGEAMSGPIVRTGTTPEFWGNYDQVFGKKADAKAGKKKATKKKAAKKKAVVKKTTKKKVVKKAAVKKAATKKKTVKKAAKKTKKSKKK